MIISIYVEEESDKIQFSFMIKILNKLEKEGNYLEIIKDIHENPTARTKLNSENLKAFLSRSGPKQGWLLLLLVFNIVLEVLARVISQEKEIKLERKK